MPELPGILGVFVTLLVCLGLTGLGGSLLKRSLAVLDPAAAFGTAGLLGLGFLGMASFAIGYIPGGLGILGLGLVGILSLVGLALLIKDRQMFAFRGPVGVDRIFPLALGLATLFVLVSTLAPSDINDWDSLAYHLAVPKLWLQAGRVEFIPSIHHSNFPFTIDILNVWGLMWGGQAGAKAFELAIYLLGLAFVFGVSRQQYGARAGWWGALAFGTVPVVMWEAGSAYIDVAHGLYAGGGLLLAAIAASDSAKRNLWLPAGLLLAFAVGTKYTGLQMVAATGFVLLAGGIASRDSKTGVRLAFSIGLLALVIGSPWYIKNVVNTGNPVYPFFYEKLGGKNWDQRRMDIYRNEQQTFGVSRTEKGRDVTGMGGAIFGVGYQPGRFVNPGQTQGLGTPLGAIGAALVAVLILVPAAGRVRKFEGLVLGAVGISLLMWFLLSQQSRYIVPLAVPLAVLGAGVALDKRLGKLAMGLIGLQSAYSLWLVNTQRTASQLPVVVGKVSAEEYQTATIPFFAASQGINKTVGTGKVALYDEVFGYLLNVPYFWANPGHCTLIPYDTLSTGEGYTRALKDQGITHVYISLSPVVKERQFAKRWMGSMGLGDPSVVFPPEERQALFQNWETKWHILLSDAIREGRLVPEQSFRSGVLFRIVG